MDHRVITDKKAERSEASHPKSNAFVTIAAILKDFMQCASQW